MRAAKWAVVLLVIGGIAMATSCGKRSEVFEPLRDPGSVVAGIVATTTGSPIAEAVITLESVTSGMSAGVRRAIEASGAREAGRVNAATLRSTVSDASGRYAFDGVAPGAYLLTAIHAHHLAGTERIDVPSSAEAVSVNIQLTPTGSFYGVASLENGTTHQSTVVYVEGTSFVAVTNPAGVYTISDVPIGTWTVRATHGGYLDQSTSGAIAAAGDSVALASMQLPLDSNIPPVAHVAGPFSGFETIPTAVNGSGTDDDGVVVRYEWDFENDGVFDSSSPASAATTHDYPLPGAYTAKLRVTDDRGAIGVAVVTVNVGSAIFVSTSGTSGNPGTRTQPISTITGGLAAATSAGKPTVIVAGGTYSETVSLPANKSIVGGYDGSTWLQVGALTRVDSGTGSLIASAASSGTIRNLTFQASDNPGGSSIAFRANGTAAGLVFDACTFQSGTAASGTTDPNGDGIAGAAGGNGVVGSPSTCQAGTGTGGAGGSSSAGCTGGAGGNGGSTGGGSGAAGAAGACSGGNGGPGGGSPPADGGNGVSGAAGSHGVNGIAGSSLGDIMGVNWIPGTSTSGAPGAAGRGGGGGGGGAGGIGSDGSGSGGGGGGGGGGPGTGGLPGTGGYASFAVYLFNGSPTFTNCTFRSGNGGAGGAGRNGGVGGNGGAGRLGGNTCPTLVGAGGNGGAGGKGGSGGGGAGGPGGPSFGVFRVGTGTPSITSATYVIGAGGAGGAGGLSLGQSAAPSGPTGATGNIH